MFIVMDMVTCWPQQTHGFPLYNWMLMVVRDASCIHIFLKVFVKLQLNKGSFHNHPVLMKCCQIGFVDSCKETEHVERLALLLKTLIYQCQSIQLVKVVNSKLSFWDELVTSKELVCIEISLLYYNILSRYSHLSLMWNCLSSIWGIY